MSKCCAGETEAACASVTFNLTSDGSQIVATAAPYSCTGFWKFINDDTGAKPPFLDDFEIDIVKCDPNDADYDGTMCSTICYTGASTRAAVSWLITLTVTLTAMAVAMSA